MINKTIHIMIGVAGAGKSTAVEKIHQKLKDAGYDVKIICPDDLREKFCNGDRSDQSKNGPVWDKAYADVNLYTQMGYPVIFDSTMVSPKKRKQLIRMAKSKGYKVEADVVERDLDTIKSQNEKRKWAVPEHIIDNMFKAFTRPTIAEGFDTVVDY